MLNYFAEYKDLEARVDALRDAHYSMLKCVIVSFCLLRF